MKKKIAIVCFLAMVFIAFTAGAFATDPIKLYVNGQEMKPDVLPQLVNGRTMVPVRWIAEVLDAEVKWDKNTNSVLINSKTSPALISKERVATLVEEQGKSSDYYIEGLSYELVNLDGNDDLEIVAKIDGAVHLGQFFIFKKDFHGEYQLITEQYWKVERCNFDNPLEIEGKKLFEVVTRSGGTGLDTFNVHLIYLEQENFIEAWQGTLLERSVALPGSYYKKIGSYQVDTEGKRLYAWETAHQLDQDGVTPKGEVKTATTIYFFDGKKFINAAEKNSTLQEIKLTYTPEPVTVLEPCQPEKGWEKAKSVEWENVSGQEKVMVHLYIETAACPESQGEVRAFLEHNGVMYNLGIAGFYGLNAISVEAKDVNHDGKKELVITGGMGAAYVERKIIGYDASKSHWIKLLTFGSPLDVDLDGDGREDVVAVSAGSLPGYVWLYRWNKDHFEKTDVAKATGNIYAYIEVKNDKVWIESGEPGEPHYYQFQAGKLVEIKQPPVPQF